MSTKQDLMFKIMETQAKELNIEWKTRDELIQKMFLAWMPTFTGANPARNRLQELIDIERDREFAARPKRHPSQAIRLANSSN